MEAKLLVSKTMGLPGGDFAYPLKTTCYARYASCRMTHITCRIDAFRIADVPRNLIIIIKAKQAKTTRARGIAASICNRQA
jgi:hypothetical protein